MPPVMDGIVNKTFAHNLHVLSHRSSTLSFDGSETFLLFRSALWLLLSCNQSWLAVAVTPCSLACVLTSS